MWYSAVMNVSDWRRLDVVEYVQYCKALGVSPIDGIRLIDIVHPTKTSVKKKEATK